MQITPNLFAWQINNYPLSHADRRNLLIHALTQPLFVAGLFLTVLGFWPGLAGMALAVAAQGRGHKLEAEAPAPFRSPLDGIVRLVVEQLVTFPRFVFSGGFARAWRSTPGQSKREA